MSPHPMSGQGEFPTLLDDLRGVLAKIERALPDRIDDEAEAGEVVHILGTLQGLGRQLGSLTAYAEMRAADLLTDRITDWPDGMRAEATRDTTSVWDDTETVRALCADLLVDDAGEPVDMPPAVWRILGALPKNHGWKVTDVGKYAGNLDDLRAREVGRRRVKVTMPKAGA